MAFACYGSLPLSSYLPYSHVPLSLEQPSLCCLQVHSGVNITRMQECALFRDPVVYRQMQ